MPGMSLTTIGMALGMFGGAGGPACTATDTHDGSVTVGTTFTHEADAIIDYTVDSVASGGGGIQVQFRKQDDNNCWLTTIDGAGTLKLVERVSGADTTRLTIGVTAVTDADRVIVLAEGASISLYINSGLQNTYNSASNFQNETDGAVSNLGTGGVVSDLITRPVSDDCKAAAGIS